MTINLKMFWTSYFIFWSLLFDEALSIRYSDAAWGESEWWSIERCPGVFYRHPVSVEDGIMELYHNSVTVPPF